MKQSTKNVLIVGTVIVVIGLGYYLWNKDSKKKAVAASTGTAPATTTTKTT